MSLRKSPHLTPELLAATRRNAAHSTGPRSPGAKCHVKMNALKHGIYAAPENEPDVMRALGEDPQEYDLLKRELALTYGPGDALWQKQLEDLGRLYWRQKRIERQQTGLKRRALREVETRHEQRDLEMAAATFDASRVEMLELDLPEPADAGVRARLRLSYLELIRAQVQQEGSPESPSLDLGGAYVSAPFAGMYAPGGSAPAEERIHRDENRHDVCATQSSSSFAGGRPMGTDPGEQVCAASPPPGREIAPAAALSRVLESLYRARLTWQAVRMRKLLHALESPGPALEPEEALRAELLALLGKEIGIARAQTCQKAARPRAKKPRGQAVRRQ